MLALIESGEYLPAVDETDLALFDRLATPTRVVRLSMAAGHEGNTSISLLGDL